MEIDRNSFCLLNVIANISLNTFAYYIFYKCANVCGLIINNGSASFFIFYVKILHYDLQSDVLKTDIFIVYLINDSLQ